MIKKAQFVVFVCGEYRMTISGHINNGDSLLETHIWIYLCSAHLKST